jgi:hypothetical protein
MTVGDLREFLQEMDPDLEVFAALDNEGDACSPLVECLLSKYIRYRKEIDIVHPEDLDGTEKDCVLLVY